MQQIKLVTSQVFSDKLSLEDLYTKVYFSGFDLESLFYHIEANSPESLLENIVRHSCEGIVAAGIASREDIVSFLEKHSFNTEGHRPEDVL